MKNYQFNYYLNQHPYKQIILFLHGFMGNIHEFDNAIQILLQDFSYLTIDLPGHGQTQVLGGDEYYNMENTAQGIIELLDKLNIYQCYLVGYSMGGRLGLYLALHYPERFTKVVLESASPGLKTEQERLARIKQDEQIARKLARSVDRSIFKNFLLHWYKQPIFGDIKNHPDFENMINNRLQNHPPELAKSLRIMGTGCQPYLWNKIKDNQIPILLLVGDNDKKFININQEISQISESYDLKIINNASHNTHLENTIDFVRYIRYFLER